ncbi:MAG: hypothetical protein ABIH00_03635 [Armatimonadota bacterium]
MINAIPTVGAGSIFADKGNGSIIEETINIKGGKYYTGPGTVKVKYSKKTGAYLFEFKGRNPDLTEGFTAKFNLVTHKLEVKRYKLNNNKPVDKKKFEDVVHIPECRGQEKYYVNTYLEQAREITKDNKVKEMIDKTLDVIARKKISKLEIEYEKGIQNEPKYKKAYHEALKKWFK